MRIAIIGAGIAGLAAAYELNQQSHLHSSPIDFHLYESTHRLGGIIDTVRPDGPDGPYGLAGFVIESGPDSWVTEKPWARELAEQLGLAGQIIPSNDFRRRNYILSGRQLTATPDGMRMMVPSAWAPLLESPLFTTQAKLAYLREPKRADELKSHALTHTNDESVSSFVRRHFGDEVTTKMAAPLLAGVFGGDVDLLSVHSVMPAFVKMEREYGSLITAVRTRAAQNAADGKPQQPVFTTLRDGMATLVEAIVSTLPATSIRLNTPVTAITRATTNSGQHWHVHSADQVEPFDAILVATPAHVTRALLNPLDARIAALLDMDASSAISVALAFSPESSAKLRIPRGFGFLVPQSKSAPNDIALMAATFVDQKFNHRAPAGAVLLRGFIGGAAATQLSEATDTALVDRVHTELGRILGPLPTPLHTIVRRWPRSLPQYAVGHLDRIAEVEQRVASLPNLSLIGNAFHGVGVPDLIRDGRAAARKLLGISG